MYFSTSLENVGSMSRVLNKMIPNQLIAIINYDTMHQDPKWTDFIVITTLQHLRLSTSICYFQSFQQSGNSQFFTVMFSG